jgi:hypothetical protein
VVNQELTMTTTQRTNYGVKEIAELFPSLMKIKDASLREKVAAVWNEAITTGCGGKGWTFDELRAVKFTLLAGDIDMTFVEHLNSCARQCIAIADVLEKSFRCGIPIQRDYLIAGALLADVIGGRVPMTFQNMAAILPTVRENKLRGLAVTSLKRSSVIPELPTVAESGYPGFEAVSWFALLGPRGTPAPILIKLHRD